PAGSVAAATAIGRRRRRRRFGRRLLLGRFLAAQQFEKPPAHFLLHLGLLLLLELSHLLRRVERHLRRRQVAAREKIDRQPPFAVGERLQPRGLLHHAGGRLGRKARQDAEVERQV